MPEKRIHKLFPTPIFECKIESYKELNKDLKNYIENLAEKKFTKVLFHIPFNSYKISSWLYKNSHVYDETFCDIDFVGNKVKAKISNDKLNSFKSHFPEIELYTI